MAMGTRHHRQRQEQLWVTHTELATGPGHPFYTRLNELLDQERFDDFVESECARFYAAKNGRPSLPPGTYFRLLLIGYFEGIDSERGIAWRAADSLALRRFLHIGLDEETPDHSTLSRTRRLIDLDSHRKVFRWVLGVIADRGLLKGKTVGVDATTLEANAAMRSIVRRDTGAKYEEFLAELAKEAGLEKPSREELAQLDRKRKKKVSNAEWMSPSDPDARIAKMKDGTTHLAHKAEHAVDLETGAVVAVTLQPADEGDTTTIKETLAEAADQVAHLIEREAAKAEQKRPQVSLQPLAEVVADKGYHSGEVVQAIQEAGGRSYIAEPKRGRRQWAGKAAEQRAVYANRRRMKGRHGQRLRNKRGELVERSFAHCYETGAMRRVYLRGRENILKRQLIHIGAFNLSLIFRKETGAGTPRELGNRQEQPLFAIFSLLGTLRSLLIASWRHVPHSGTSSVPRRGNRALIESRLASSNLEGFYHGLLTVLHHRGPTVTAVQRWGRR
jgi:transposase